MSRKADPSHLDPSRLASLLDELAAYLAARVAEHLRSELARCPSTEAAPNYAAWVDQAASPLGRKRHCAVVRRLVQEGKDGAAIIGRRFLLSPSAMNAELRFISSERLADERGNVPQDDGPTEDELLERYGLRRVKRDETPSGSRD